MSGSDDEEMALNDGKQQHQEDDEDLGSQQSILKWIRHVPGPLQDVMKKRADQLDNSQGEHCRIASVNTHGYSVAIATVFDQGPWVDMCLYLGMPAVSGELYGKIKVSSLKNTIGNIVDNDQALAKIPQLLVLIKSVRYVDEEIVAVLRDPSGEVEGYFHRELVEQIGPALVAGVGVLLYKVSVFTPSDAPVTGRRTSYLNITPRNVRRVFIPTEKSNSLSVQDPVEAFNKEKEIASRQESDSDDYDDNLASTSEQAARQLLQHSTVRDTSAELTFLSQRQVIHRNPPVRVDHSAATTTSKKTGKRARGATASKNQDQETGLGKWQWNKLLKKTDDETVTDSSRSQERRDFLDASSRLVSLITKQNARNRALPPPGEKKSSSQSTLASTGPKKSASVRFAPGTVFDPPTHHDSDNFDGSELTQRSPSLDPSSSQPTPPSQTFDEDKTNNSDEDEDDDW